MMPLRRALRRPWSVVLVAAGAFVCVASPAQAAPNQKAQCIAAAEATQDLREKKQLLAAREQVLKCAVDACPAVVRTECVAWLREIDETTPSLVFRARDENGQDLVEVRVLLDGKLVAAKLDGSSLRLDPGEHTVRFEAHDAARPAVEQKVLVPLGEKNRVITAQLAKPGAAPVPSATTSGPPPEPVPPPIEPSKLRVLPFVALGVGGVGLVTFGVFQGLGRSQKSDLDAGCGRTKTCADSEVSSVRTKFVVSGVGLGVGVVGVALGGALLAFRGPAKTTASVQPLPGGSGFALSGRF